MSLLKPKKIDEVIMSIISRGPIATTRLVEQVNRRRSATTKQAVYAALRQMKSREEVVNYRGMSALNVTWLNQVSAFISASKRAYLNPEQVGDDITSLAPGDSITYYFRNPLKADIFWTHAYYLLMENSPAGEPVYLYNPHEWFLLARNRNEVEVIKNTVDSGRKFLLSCGSNTPLDRYVKKYFDGGMSQYYMLSKPKFKPNYYLNIFGDIMFEVWLDKQSTRAIDDFYRKTTAWTVQAEEKLRAIVKQNHKLRIRVSHNRKKAGEFKKFCKKLFVV